MTGESEMPAMEPSAPPSAAPGMGGDADGMPAPIATGATTVRATTTTTTTVTVTVEGGPPPPAQRIQPVHRLLTAASVGDSDRRGNYLDFLQRQTFEGRSLGLDMTRRIRFRVVDPQGRPVHGARLLLEGLGVEGRSHADGVWDFYPGVSAPHWQGGAQVAVSFGGRMLGRTEVHIPARGDGQDVTIVLNGVQAESPRALDLAFVIDATGSMEDELRYVNREIGEIVARIRAEAPETLVRVGAVFYRDRTDSAPIQRIAFTSDIAGFARAMQSVAANGGGDYPEDMSLGLEAALHQLSWSDDRALKVAVLVADAPPQHYGTQFTYRDAMREASTRGIRILPVAASGANRQVEYLFRAMGSMTSTPYVYLTDDSGIGGRHLEADTDRVAIEYLSDLLTRLVASDLRGQGMHEPGPFGPA
ncbi:MAG: VWA domain-containing protein [Myxococcales bacterium]|nr:VWA domain-containing protein [Myxococcales bacterium]